MLLQGPEKKANSTVVNDKPKPKAKAKSNLKKKTAGEFEEIEESDQSKGKTSKQELQGFQDEVWVKGWKEVIQCFA